jgi:predicted dehydrogenase/threonine dehydrogenase-like Zn-dependent dehydrogenase
MRALLEDVRSGALALHEVPSPELLPGGILVRTLFSVISSGTERAKLETSKKSLVGKALVRPDLVKQVLDVASREGVRSAYQKVQARLNTLSPLGYSCSGVVLAAGEGVTGFQPGDRVACAGAGFANHSEINFIPRNLAVRVPESVPLDQAALTTIGAIALQGFRQSGSAFGETIAVIGAGLVGVLTVALGRAAGCRMIAVDLESQRAAGAERFGAICGLPANDPSLPEKIRNLSGFGVDAAILTAATRSTDPIELAAQIVRDRGRIVVVGDVSMAVSRSAAYAKELSIVLSRSYGPGRYDSSYEEDGVDYPIGYVRWTENRNMQAFLEFLASGKVEVSPLLERRYPIDEASRAYEELKSSGAYTAVLEYPETEPHPSLDRKPAAPPALSAGPRSARPGPLRIGFIGAGNFARGVILPRLRSNREVLLASVATGSGVSAESVRRSFGVARTQTPSDLLEDPENDAVFILSRHDSHARYLLAALARGKPAFVEKPLAVDFAQLEEIRAAYRQEISEGRSPFVMVGFNRRFAPLSAELHKFFASRKEPMLVHVRVNAGFLPHEHWTQRPSDGGRIVGEFCHFVDWARFVVNVPIKKVQAAALPDGARYNQDNVVAVLSFEDGSVANLLYLANGDPSVPKESYEVFCEGSVARLDDFRSLDLTRQRKTTRTRGTQDKGHQKELELTIDAIRSGREAPIPFSELCEVTEATLTIREALATGQTVALPLRPAS